MTVLQGPAQAIHARLLQDLAHAVAAGYVLQPSTVAVLVGREEQEIIRQAIADRPCRDAEIDILVQRHLRNVVTVLSVAQRHFKDVALAVNWYRNERAAPGADQTPETLVAAGRLGDAYSLLYGASEGLDGPER